MLLLSNKLIDVPIMSLQTGGEIARTTGIIIDPRTLSIPALYVDGPLVETHPSVLHVEDIREAGALGFIIDDSDKLMDLDGLIRLQAIIDFGFDIFSCQVVDKSGNKIGKIDDFSFEPVTYAIQQIFTHQSFLRSLAAASNIISRQQIISVTNEQIVVDSPTIKDVVEKKADAAAAFVNPFRQTHPQPDQIDSRQALQ